MPSTAFWLSTDVFDNILKIAILIIDGNPEPPALCAVLEKSAQKAGFLFLVAKGQKLKIEKLETEAGKPVEFSEVLFISDGKKTEIGTPLIEGAIVKAKIAGQGRGRKQIVFRYHAKTRYRKKKGHRQPFTEVEITDIKS